VQLRSLAHYAAATAAAFVTIALLSMCSRRCGGEEVDPHNLVLYSPDQHPLVAPLQTRQEQEHKAGIECYDVKDWIYEACPYQ
jgi:hypothetical protein